MTSLSFPDSELTGKRVIVTGASGFIGHTLVKRLSRIGADTLVIDRIQPAAHLPGVEFEWADLRHLNKMYEADYLIHLAAVTNAGYAEKYPMETYETNVLGMVNLLNHVEIGKRILFPSTALVYRTSIEPINEQEELEQNSVYAQSKSIGEDVLKFHSARHGVEHTIFRFFNIFGPDQLPLYIIPQVIRQLYEENKVIVRNGTVMRDMLYVDDCIEAVLRLTVTDKGTNTVFNIGSGEVVSIAEIAKLAIQVSGREDVEYTDLEENINYSPTAIMADIQKVSQTVDWMPRVSLKEGLKRVWDSYAK